MASWQSAISVSAAAAAETAAAAAGPLVAVAASLLRCSQDLSQWSLQELTSGLGLLAVRHLSEELLDSIPSAKPVTSREELLEMLHWLRWAMAAYEADTSTLSTDLNIPAAHVMRHVPAASHGKPAYVLARDEARRVVVVSVRGTHSASDVLTDLTLDSCAFQDGFAHRGMLECASWLHSQLCPRLTQVAVSQGWRIVVVGHSLGAGTAALLALLLKEDMEHLHMQQQQQQPQQPQHALPQDLLGDLGTPLTPRPSGPQCPQVSPPPPAATAGATAAALVGVPGTSLSSVECWAFACPPVLSKVVAVRCSAFTRSVVLQHDIVPRLCPEAFEDLRVEVMREMKSVPARAPKAPPRPAAGGSSSSSSTMSMLGLVAAATAGALLSQATSPAAAAAGKQPITGTPAAGSTPPAAAGAGAGAGSGAGAGGWSSSSSLMQASFKSLSLIGTGTSTGTSGGKAVPSVQGSATAAPASTWLSVAGAVASVVLDQRASSQSGGPPSSSTDRGVTALTRAAGSVLERRLCVPGVPYHILRHVKTEGAAPPRTVQDLIDQEQRGGSGGESEVLLFLRERQGMDERGVSTGEEAPTSSSSSSASSVSSSWSSLWPSESPSHSSQTAAAAAGAASSSHPASTTDASAGGGSGGGGASATFKAAGWATVFTSALQTAVSSSISGSGRGPSVLPTERYSVVKGDLGGSAFKRLVIATSVLSDHSCKLQGAAIINALQWG